MNRCDTLTELDEERLAAHLPGVPARDRLLVVLGMETGLRLSELLRLKVEDVWRGDRPVSVLQVSRRHLKGGSGAHARSVTGRSIPLNESAREALAGLLAPANPVDGEPLFPSREGMGPLTRRQGSRIVKYVLLGAGLDPDRVWGGHSLRRRFCQRIYEATGDIDVTRAAVGHRWIATTQQYLGLTEDSAGAAILALGQRIPRPASPASESAATV